LHVFIPIVQIHLPVIPGQSGPGKTMFSTHDKTLTIVKLIYKNNLCLPKNIASGKIWTLQHQGFLF